mgnify:CR=1 FL=1
MNYANLDYARNMFGTVPYDLWFARYNATPGRSDMAMWQYTSSGSVPGIVGKVDMNYCYKDYVGASAPVRAWVEYGDRGQDVRDLQDMLNQIGYTLRWMAFRCGHRRGGETVSGINRDIGGRTGR